MGFEAKNLVTPSGNKTEGVTASKDKLELSKQEVELLLQIIRNSTFNGSAIESMYHLTYKLQLYYNKLNK
jgi:hypothetical protein